MARLLIAAASRPRLVGELVGAAWRFRRRRWWAAPPFLPLPPREYLDWRQETAFGAAAEDPPIESLLRFLRWSARQSRPAGPDPRAGFVRLRTILAALLILAAILAIPPVRERADPLLEPGKVVLDRTVGGVLGRGRDQVFRWSVQNEVRTLALELQKREASGQPLPRPQDFQSYLQRRTISGTPGLDKWGSPYYMLLSGDSITVVSPGADGRPGTVDDIRESVGRDR